MNRPIAMGIAPRNGVVGYVGVAKGTHQDGWKKEIWTGRVNKGQQ